MVAVRWTGAVFAAYQVLVFDNRPYPSPTFRTLGLALAATLAVGNLAIFLTTRRVSTLRGARAIAICGILLDVSVASGFVYLFAFDPLSALWAVLLILPMEGAIMFQLRGALFTWAATLALYVPREAWGAQRFPAEYPLGVQWSSITFRMGIALLIGMVAGLMARDLVRQRTQLRQTLGRVQRLDRMRQELVNTLAHDVRNPLTAIRGTLTLLLTRSDKVDAETGRELLGNADRQARRLETLAEDLLELARLEKGRLDLAIQYVTLRETVERGLSFTDHESAYRIDIPEDLRLRADPGRLEQIVVNLASNALRYGEAPFEARAHVDGDAVVLTLRDHGPGIPESEARHLFDPFRAEQKKGSVGLGLAIVKGLAEAHGGTVRYLPNEPRGACFEVRLPLTGPREPATV